MLKAEQAVMKKGMDCLNKNLGVVEIEMFISALMKYSYDYTKWRKEYFENAYNDEPCSQLENFLKAASSNDPHGVSIGLR